MNASLVVQMIKNPPVSVGDARDGFNPWVGKIPWKRKWQPTAVFLPRKFHGQRSLMNYSPYSHKESEITENVHVHTHTHTDTHTQRHTHTHRHTHIPGIYSRISKPTQIQWSRGSERDSQRSAFPRKTPLLILNNLNSSATWQLISLNYKLRRLFRKGISQRLGLCHSAELYPRSPQQHCHILGTQYMCLLDEWVNGRMKEGIPRQPGNLMF